MLSVHLLTPQTISRQMLRTYLQYLRYLSRGILAELFLPAAIRGSGGKPADHRQGVAGRVLPIAL